MTTDQVRALVGKPLVIDASGTYWDYSHNNSTPKVRFQPVFVNGAIGPGLVTEWDTQTDGRDNQYDAMIEAANALALEPPGPDRTNQVGECTESGLRILAYVEQGMTTGKVRELIGKPIEISVSGTYWEYGERYATPEVRFSPQSINGVLGPDKVREIDCETRGCGQ